MLHLLLNVGYLWSLSPIVTEIVVQALTLFSCTGIILCSNGHNNAHNSPSNFLLYEESYELQSISSRFFPEYSR